MAINQYGLNVGYHLDDEAISAWQDQGKNCTNRDARGWHTSTSPFSGDRTISGFQEINGIVGFAVSGTGGPWYLRAEGFQEFERDYLKTQSTGNTPTELTSLPEKWYIEITEENKDSLDAFKKSKGKTPLSKGHYYFVDYQGFGLSEGYSGSYKQITFDQFKKWVLKQDETSASPQTNNSLLEEAKRRYSPGTRFRSSQNNKEYTVSSGSEFEHVSNDNIICLGVVPKETNILGEYIYFCNKWAEIIEMPAKQSGVPEYVEMVRTYGNATAQTVGKIYKTDGDSHWIDDDGAWRPTLKDCLKDGDFKPSTKEAYERQQNTDKSLIGRRVKIISDETTDKLPIGSYHQITHDKYFKTNKTIFVDNRPHSLIESEFELMPEGFVPPPKDWKPNVGEYIYFLEKVSYHEMGDVAKVINIGEWKTGDKEWIDVYGKRKDGFAWPNYKHLIRSATPEEIGESRRKPQMMSSDWPIYIHKGESVGPSYIDIETAPRKSWYDVEEDRARKEFLSNPDALGYGILKPRQFGATSDLATAIGYSILAGQNFKSNISPSVKPSSKVSVKSHEEFKINIIKPKTIKL